MTSIIPNNCTSTTNLGKVIISSIDFCGVAPGAYVPSAGEAAVNYAETQVTPVVDKITSELQEIAFFLLFLIVLLVMIPLLLLIIWTGFELNLPNRYVLIGVLFVIVFTAILAYLVYKILSNSVLGRINNAVSNLSNLFNDPASIGLVISTLERAVKAYLGI